MQTPTYNRLSNLERLAAIVEEYDYRASRPTFIGLRPSAKCRCHECKAQRADRYLKLTIVVPQWGGE